MKRTLGIIILGFMIFELQVCAEEIGNGDYICKLKEDGTAAIERYIGGEEDVKIPEYIDDYRVTEIEDLAFYPSGCIKSVEMPEGIVKIGNVAFGNCGELNSVTIPASVNEIGVNPFQNCFMLCNIDVSEDNPHYFQLDGVLYDRENSKLVSYPLGKEVTMYSILEGTKEIGDSAFEHCALENVRIPDGVSRIGDLAFANSKKLNSISIPHSVTEIGKSSFYYCENLEDAKILGNISVINRESFEYCQNLKHVELPASVTEIAESAFAGCQGLVSINIPDNVIELGDAAFGLCVSLQDVDIPNGMAKIGNIAFLGCSISNISIPSTVSEIGDNPFARCNFLKNIDLAEDNAYYTQIDGVLYNKNVDKLISCPAGKEENAFYVPEGVLKIGNYAFSGCSNYESIQLPDGIVEIGNYAFAVCNSLSSVKLPDSITEIQESAFENSDKVVLIVDQNSYALQWAQANDVSYTADM